MKVLLGFLFIVPLSSAEARLTSADLASWLWLRCHQTPKGKGVKLELDREERHCIVFHAYRLGGDPREGQMTFTIGWWSVDLRTGEVWNFLIGERVINQEITKLQRAIRNV